MTIVDQIWQFVLSGVTAGGIYAIIAIGFVTIYSVTGIINFAQGEFVMLGAMVGVALHRAQVPLPLTFVLSVALVTVIGALVQRVAIHPARQSSIITLIIITIGVSIAIRGVALVLWGSDPMPLPAFSGEAPIFLFGATIMPQGLWVLGFMVLIVVGLTLFFDRTIMGKALQACAINRPAARLMGVSADRMALFSFALSAALGAVAGIVVAPITSASYDAGTMLGLKGFVAAAVGGLSSTPGAVAGGLLLGIVESLCAGLLSSGYKDAVAFVLLLVVLLWRPSGIFGKHIGKGRL